MLAALFFSSRLFATTNTPPLIRVLIFELIMIILGRVELRRFFELILNTEIKITSSISL